MRKWILGISTTVVLVAGFLLISGSELLLITLHEPSHLPSGTIITWLGLIALPVALLSTSEWLFLRKAHGKLYGTLLRLCLLISTFWGFISYGLSGRWNFTFRGDSPTYVGSAQAGEIFWNLTYTLVALPVLVVLAFGVQTFISWSLRKR